MHGRAAEEALPNNEGMIISWQLKFRVVVETITKAPQGPPLIAFPFYPVKLLYSSVLTFVIEMSQNPGMASQNHHHQWQAKCI